MNTLNYHHLRYFHAVVQSGNLTKAARLLNVSQSSVSVQIKQLEESLRTSLFARDHKSLQLTETGRMVMDYAETIFRTGNELLAMLDNRKEGPFREKLRVGSAATLSRNFQLHFLRPVIEDTIVEVVIQSAALPELLNRLSEHQLDLVLSNRKIQRQAGNPLRCELIAQQAVSLLRRPDTNKKGRFRFPQDIAHTPIVLPTLGNEIRDRFDQILERHGVIPLIAAEADDMAMLRLLAREMDALALLPPVVVADEIAAGWLVEVARIDDLFESFYAIIADRRYPNPHVKKLLQRGQDLF